MCRLTRSGTELTNPLGKHRWQDWEREVVRLRYRQNDESAQEIANELGVTFYAVKGQTGRLGLCKKTGRKNWDPMQDGQLQRFINRYCVTEIAKRMHRSVNSVVLRSKRLGLSRRFREGWYTKREVMEICGVDHSRVQSWINKGMLKASYHNGIRPSQKGMRMWHIEEGALKNFLRRYPQELNGRNVDLIQIIDVVAGLITEGPH